MTGAALAATAYSRLLGKKIELAASSGPQDTEEAAKLPIDTGNAWSSSTPCMASSSAPANRPTVCGSVFHAPCIPYGSTCMVILEA